MCAEDVVYGDLLKATSFVRPMIVGRATGPADALAS
jgi:hypothetical protein